MPYLNSAIKSTGAACSSFITCLNSQASLSTSMSSMASSVMQSPILKSPHLRLTYCPPLVRHVTSPTHANGGLMPSVKHVASSHSGDGRMLRARHVAAALHTDDRMTVAYPAPEVAKEIRKPRPFWVREWTLNDVVRVVFFTAIHLMCLLAPFQFTWPAFYTFVALYFVTGLFGITLGYHRCLTHRSFDLPKWLEYTCAYCGVLAGQGNPIDWVSTHRYHHQFADMENDPHSPNEGFWFSHMKWAFDRTYLTAKCGEPDNVSDLTKQLFYRFIESTYYIHVFGQIAVLYAIGGLPFVVWGAAMRYVWVTHITLCVGSVCHIWGNRVWNTSCNSKNNWWVGILAFGEGWQNNHHAFEWSARQGLEWWQIDMTYGVIRVLQALGLATDVKLPTEQQKKRMALENSLNLS